MAIEFLPGGHYMYFRFQDHRHIQIEKDLAEMLLSADSAEASSDTHDCRWLAFQHRYSLWARGPVNSILEHARSRIVVFRGNDQQRVSQAYFLSKKANSFRRVIFVVLVEEWQLIERDNF